eukprot:11168333-Alexandrium_andersonii.AAC.1
MSAYSGKCSRSVRARVKSGVYGWRAGGPAETIEYLGGPNAAYVEFLQYLAEWVQENQGLMVLDPAHQLPEVG